ncbi:MAG TPA: tetratricopeptide repeat protein [Verrucomicrobiae bacterium]|nr:tetratricopeptide repeat protein [Verrucomicrobiae bacterium]
MVAGSNPAAGTSLRPPEGEGEGCRAVPQSMMERQKIYTDNAMQDASLQTEGKKVEPSSRLERRGELILGLFLIAATLAAYQPVWRAGFIWDDAAYVTPPGLRSLAGLVRIWIHLGATLQYYPLVYSGFWVEHLLWGDTPLGYHLINVLLHISSVLLLLKILRRLEVPGAWLVAALFALHPIEVESVAWISELKNTLSAVFYLSAALIYLEFDRTRNKANYSVSLGLFILGLMSKTVIASLPGALLVVFWWKRGKISWSRDVLPLVPFFIAGFGAGLLTAWMEQKIVIGAKATEYHFSIIERFLIAGRDFWFYLGKLFWPTDLIFMYPRWDVSQWEWWQYLFPAAALLLLGTLIWRRWRGPAAALLFFVGTLFPALGFFNVYPFRYSFVADHFQYLAGIGPLTLAPTAIFGALDYLKTGTQFPKAVCLTLLLSLGVLTWQQCGMYHDVETLWNTTIARNPDCWMAYNNLGEDLFQKGAVDDAILLFQKSLEINPDNDSAQVNLGCALFDKGQLNEGMIHFQRALEIAPDNPDVQYNLGKAYLQEGQFDEAIRHFKRTLEINSDYSKAQDTLGNALFQKGDTKEAITHFQKALDINPDDADAQNNLALTLATCPQASLRDGKKAVKLAERANQLTGDENPTYLATLAAAYAEAARFPEAIQTAQRALQFAGTQSNTGLANLLQSQIKLYQQKRPFHLR